MTFMHPNQLNPPSRDLLAGAAFVDGAAAAVLPATVSGKFSDPHSVVAADCDAGIR